MAKVTRDNNGWLEVDGNKLSRPGIFPYLGREIHPSLEPDRVYQVLRPIEELEDPECAKSFRLQPWIIGHEMLGDKGVDAEAKGIHGIIGDNVFFDPSDLWLKGNIKAFTKALEDEIAGGYNELSLGYACEYEFNPGKLDGTRYKVIPGVPVGAHYDVVQKKMRGNHLASVDKSRMDVAVFDKASAMDTMTIKIDEGIMDNTNKQGSPAAPAKAVAKDQDIAEAAKAISSLIPLLTNLSKLFQAGMGATPESSTENPPPSEPMEGEEDEMVPPKPTDSEDENTPKEKEEGAMDSNKISSIVNAAVAKATKPLIETITALKAENAGMDQRIMKDLTRRDELAEKLSAHIGAFDHKTMSLAEVTEYGVKKLGLVCDAKDGAIALEAYLHNRPASKKLYSVLDNAPGASECASALDEYING